MPDSGWVVKDANGNIIRKAHIWGGHEEDWLGAQSASLAAARGTDAQLLWNGNDASWHFGDVIDGPGTNSRGLFPDTTGETQANSLAGPADHSSPDLLHTWIRGWGDDGLAHSVDANGVPVQPADPPPSAGADKSGIVFLGNQIDPAAIVALPSILNSTATQDPPPLLGAGVSPGLETGALFLSSAPSGNPAAAINTGVLAPQQATVNLAPQQLTVSLLAAAASPSNRIVAENALPGTPRSYWDVDHSNQIEGFTTDFSVNAGQEVDFKINVNGTAAQTLPYKIEIFRLGY